MLIPRHTLPAVFLLVITLFSVVPCAAQSDSPRPVGVVFTLKGGIIGGGEITIERGTFDRSFDLVTATSFGAGLELPSSHFFTLGFTADIHQVDPEYMDSRTMFDIGVALKHAAKRRGTLVRPWLGLSYGHVSDFDFWAEASSYFILKGGVEFDFFAQQAGTGFLVDVGLISSLSGKSGADDVSTSIRPLVRLGIIFRG